MSDEKRKSALRECEGEPLNFDLPFSEFYEVHSFKKSFVLVSKEYNTVIATFDALEKVAPNVYILSRKADNELVLIAYLDSGLHVFKKIKEYKLFKEYILITYTNDEKELYYISDDMFRKCEFSSLKEYTEAKDYIIIRLPNDKFTLLTKDLRVADIEFTAIKECVKSFVIVAFDNMFQSCAVIRLCDLKVSPKYFNIHFYGNSEEYVKVYEFANPPRIMKVSNFEESEAYILIQYLSDEYALVKKECYSEKKILRLKDFWISKWEKDQI